MKQTVNFSQDLKRNPYKGLYIAFEGIDGSGKSTQSKVIFDLIKLRKFEVVTINEPSINLITGKLLRQILSEKIKLPSSGFQAIFSADRAINHSNYLVPALKAGKVVLSHRSNWTSIPYGIEDISSSYNESNTMLMATSNGMLSYYHQFIIPDVTIYLDVSLQTAIKRLTKMTKGKEIYENKSKLENILKGYHYLLQKFPKEFIVINGENSEDKVTSEILKIIQNKLINIKTSK